MASIKEFNVQNDEEAARQLGEATGQIGVLQIQVNDKSVLIFAPDCMQKLVRFRRLGI